MTETYEQQYKKMTETPVHKLVLSLGLPTTISMLVTNLYNIADTFFVSQIGTSASGATGVVFALMAIIQAFGFMLGHGAGSNLSRRLGASDIASARRYASTSFFLSLLCGSLIMALGLIFCDPLMRLLGSTDTILPYARIYGRYILIAAPAMASSCVMNNILRYEGKAFYAMIGLASGGILNIFGDLLFIYGFHMGIGGAGLSTMLSQYIGAVLLILPFLQKKVQSRFSIAYVTRCRGELLSIITVGLPSMARQGLNSVSIMVLNLMAAPYGDAAIAAMSIVSRIMNFLFCVGLGIGQGFQPVSAYNYGAKKYRRLKEAFYFTLKFGTGMLCIFALFGFVFATPLIHIFREDAEVLAIGVPALRMQCVTLLLVPISVCGNMLFQSIGKSGRAFFLACTRSGIIFVPVILLLSHSFGLFGIEISQSIADILSAAVTIPFFLSFFRTLPKEDE